MRDKTASSTGQLFSAKEFHEKYRKSCLFSNTSMWGEGAGWNNVTDDVLKDERAEIQVTAHPRHFEIELRNR